MFKKHSAGVVEALAMVVDKCEALESIKPVIQELALKHIKKGVADIVLKFMRADFVISLEMLFVEFHASGSPELFMRKYKAVFEHLVKTEDFQGAQAAVKQKKDLYFEPFPRPVELQCPVFLCDHHHK